MSFQSKVSARLAAALLLGTFATSAAHATVSSFSFSGASFTNGSSLNGTISYNYDAAFNVTSIVSASITVGAGNGAPGYVFTYNVPAKANTVSAPAIVVNDASNRVYAAQFTNGTEMLYPEWQGVGSAARLITSSGFANDGYTSYDNFALSQEGRTVVASDTAAVPEPASLSIIGLGLAAVGLVRRRRS